MNVLIFANPYSGRRDNPRIVERFEQALAGAGLEPHVVWQRDRRVAALQEAGGDIRGVVAAGGDGSVADAVNDMHAAGRLDLPFATVPVGTENLFAREFGFAVEPEAVAAAVAAGQTRPVDLGQVRAKGGGDETARLFTLMTSAGFDAEVVHRVDRWRRATADGSLRRVKRQSYLPRVLSAMRGYRHPLVTLTAGGQTFSGGQVYAFNLPQYGGHLAIGQHAAPDDGKLAWVVFEKPGFLNLLGYHWLVLRRKHLRSKTVAHGHAESITIAPTNGHPTPAQTDGDPTGFAPIQVSIRPGALNVVKL